jgi:Uma2 family endonuclease
MIAAGILTNDDRVELIEGQLVLKMPKGPGHSTGSEKCWRAIDRLLPVGWHVRIEKPVRIPARDSMPEPDVLVARGDVDDYAGRDPDPDDVALVVEVARSSVADDRKLAQTYGGGSIPVYWIVNLVDRQLEVYANPAGGAYPTSTIIGESDSVELVIDGRVIGRIAVADLLPRRP